MSHNVANYRTQMTQDQNRTEQKWRHWHLHCKWCGDTLHNERTDAAAVRVLTDSQQ